MDFLRKIYLFILQFYYKLFFLFSSKMNFDEQMSLKPNKFNGSGFKRWQEQLEAWLVTLGLITALGKIPPFQKTSTSSSSDLSKSSESQKQKPTEKSTEEIEYFCKFRILSCLSDDLYETYRLYNTAKEVWEALEHTYTKDNESKIRFTASDFNNYKMVDDKPIIDQIHKFQNFVHEIHRSGTKLDENFQVSSLLDKLPPKWSSFAQELRRSQTVLTVKSVIQSIRIEDQFRTRLTQDNQMKAKVNLTESNHYNSKSKNKFQNHQNRANNFKAKGKNFKPRSNGPNPNSSKPNPQS